MFFSGHFFINTDQFNNNTSLSTIRSFLSYLILFLYFLFTSNDDFLFYIKQSSLLEEKRKNTEINRKLQISLFDRFIDKNFSIQRHSGSCKCALFSPRANT